MAAAVSSSSASFSLSNMLPLPTEIPNTQSYSATLSISLGLELLFDFCLELQLYLSDFHSVALWFCPLVCAAGTCNHRWIPQPAQAAHASEGERG